MFDPIFEIWEIETQLSHPSFEIRSLFRQISQWERRASNNEKHVIGSRHCQSITSDQYQLLISDKASISLLSKTILRMPFIETYDVNLYHP